MPQVKAQPLTQAEKVAGRKFRDDAQQALLDSVNTKEVLMTKPKSTDPVAQALGDWAEGKLGSDEAGAANLVGAIVQKNYNDYATNTQQLLENYRRQEAEAKATIDLIRSDIDALFLQPWIPQPHMVLKALFPARARVEALVEERETDLNAQASSPYRSYLQ